VAFELSAKRLLIVSGKGGVGKSTIAAALGVAAARRGLRTVVAEVAGRRDIAGLLESEAGEGLREVEVYPGLRHVAIEREAALAEYLRDEVPGLLPAAILARSRAFGLFVDAAPGMGELLTIGKVWELAQRPRHKRGAVQYDLVVLDGPASGQLVGLLAAPRTFGAIARVGPVARQGAVIDRMLRDAGSVAVMAVATPEQMAVSETLSLGAALRAEIGVGLGAVVVNRMFPSRFSASDAVALAAAPDDPAVRSAQWLHARARAQRAQLVRLRRGLAEVRCSTLPFLFATHVGRAEVEELAGLLERSLP
jgi:anion-transporting  ArsA/GET3 family ATPase